MEKLKLYSHGNCMFALLCLGGHNCTITYLFSLFYHGTIHLLPQNPYVVLIKPSPPKAFHRWCLFFLGASLTWLTMILLTEELHS